MEHENLGCVYCKKDGDFYREGDIYPVIDERGSCYVVNIGGDVNITIDKADATYLKNNTMLFAFLNGYYIPYIRNVNIKVVCKTSNCNGLYAGKPYKIISVEDDGYVVENNNKEHVWYSMVLFCEHIRMYHNKPRFKVVLKSAYQNKSLSESEKIIYETMAEFFNTETSYYIVKSKMGGRGCMCIEKNMFRVVNSPVSEDGWGFNILFDSTTPGSYGEYESNVISKIQNEMKNPPRPLTISQITDIFKQNGVVFAVGDDYIDWIQFKDYDYLRVDKDGSVHAVNETRERIEPLDTVFSTLDEAVVVAKNLWKNI